MTRTTEQSNIIARVCGLLAYERVEDAKDTLLDVYPFSPQAFSKRSYGPVEMTRVFKRDGFIDRYSGDRLIFPPVLRVISTVLPEDFPFHPNWKTDVTHPAYWEVGATIDHLVPVTLGGPDEETNWMTTSMARNSAKMNWTLEDLGWQLHQPGDLADWDGMFGWFLEYTEQRPETVVTGNIKAWHRAAKAVA